MKLTVDQAIRKAATLAQKGRGEEAANICREVLRRFPADRRAAEILAAVSPPASEVPPPDEVQELAALLGTDRSQEALARASALLGRYPAAPVLHSIAGVALAQLGRFDEAVARFDRVIALAPDDAGAHRNRGNALRSLGRNEEAAASFELAARFDPTVTEAHVSRGNCLQDLGRFAEALASFDSAIALQPDNGSLWFNRGNVLRELGRHDDALASYERTVAIEPGMAEAHNNRGNLLQERGRLEAALASYDEAIRIRPELASVHNNRAVVLKDLGRPEEALAAADLALRLKPDFSAHNNRGIILTQLRRLEEALAAFDSALRLKPDSAAAYNNAGNALQDMHRLDEAVICYDAALRVDPDFVDAHGNRGNALEKLDRPVEAIASYAAALKLKPDLGQARALMLYQKAHICDWSEPAREEEVASLGIAGDAVGPFTLLAIDGDPARQLARARHWTRSRLPAGAAAPPPRAARPARLRIGYFSADYHDHATMLLMARVFELHDRSRFEIHAFAYGPDKRDAMQQRAAAAFDGFHDIRGINDAGAAALARELGIDIAIDLKGYTRDTRSAIFAFRAAPLQMSYLGYPGTMGAEFIDYIIADPVVLPPELRQHYAEKAIALPHSYQANDNSRVISSRRFERAELGLPATGFVFCCFNNNYKISSAEFDIWMRLLDRVEGSVLWLLEGNRWARANLCREAEARGVAAERLVFAPRMVGDEHLARHRCADLFLDTFNYNAHTTGSDALWAGLPIVTLPGMSFASRVGASLLHATGMGALVARTPAEYEALALSLACDPARLAAERARLARHLPAAPLFDSAGFTRDLEKAYELAFARYLAGLPPDHIELDPSPAAPAG